MAESSIDIKGDDSILEKSVAFDVASDHPGSKLGTVQTKRVSLHRRISEISLQEKGPPETVLPIAFKTLSHRIEDAVDGELDSNAKQFADKTWHTTDPGTVAAFFHSNLATGLNDSQLAEALKKYGPNIQLKPPSGMLRKVFMYFFGGFGVLLMLGGVLCCIAWKPLGQPPAIANLVLGVALFIVFLAQAAFNFVQDFTSSRVMDSINSVMPSDCRLIRNGQTTNSLAKNLVPGDVVLLEMGLKVPADVRIFEHALDLAFDRSVLTGESKPVPASIKTDLKGTNYLTSSCIAMQGTFCVTGSGKGIVVATSDSTVFGQIARISSIPKHGLSPLQKEVLRFVLITVSIIIVLVVLICILWGAWLRKLYPDWISVPTLIVDIVSVAVAFIPEGLPIALTTCLIITASVMRNKQILCKSLSVVETLGSVSVLCSDKTGTLTKNKMFVTDATLGITDLSMFFERDVEKQEDKIQDLDGVSQLHAVSALCNTATFDPRTVHLPLKDRVIHSNATDQAIFRFAELVSSTADIKDDWQLKGELSFNSKSKFMAQLYQARTTEAARAVSVGPDSLYFTIKGAPDILLSRCTHYLSGNDKVFILDVAKQHISNIQKRWANQGKRVVLLGSRILPNNRPQGFWENSDLITEYPTSVSNSDVTLVGLIGITDPPKDDIFQVVETLREAGIRLAMVTGDFELTAVAIARLCGIVTKNHVDNAGDLLGNQISSEGSIEKAVVVTSTDLLVLTDEQWKILTRYTEIVFARATPEQKLRIVEKFQAAGNIVGMTGDGINDAPSLKKADVGIAMAEGSDVAKEASDLVLLASFSSIIDALLYGRLVFENLRKTIAYLLPAGTYAELWPVLLNVIFGLPQALSSFNMILICCLTDCAGAITLAYESPERNLLKKQPRSISGERLVDYKLFLHSYFTIGTYYAFTSMLVCFLNFQRKGIPFSKLTLSYGTFTNVSADDVAAIGNISSAVYFINLVFMQFFNLMAVRTRTLSIFQHPPVLNPLTRNHLMFFSIMFSIGVTFFFNYIPWFNTSVGTAHAPVEYYFIAVGFGAVVLIYDEIRKYFVRTYPNGLAAKLAW